LEEGRLGCKKRKGTDGVISAQGKENSFPILILDREEI
jgi:hypothetical protein